MAVAVKKLNPESLQGFEEWQSEVNFLGRHYHPNIISLLGYCWEGEMLLLVCEFMQKGSLDNHLFRRGAIPLSWDIRIKIAIGAAQGLAFLHTLEKKIIRRGCHASNILLDENYNVILSDFSLAIRGPCDEESYVNTTVMSKCGYAAPEYVATGLKALDSHRPNGQQNLVEWLKKPKLFLKKKLKTIMDVHMAGHIQLWQHFKPQSLLKNAWTRNLKTGPP